MKSKRSVILQKQYIALHACITSPASSKKVDNIICPKPPVLSKYQQILRNKLDIAITREAILNSIRDGQEVSERVSLYEYRELLLLENKHLEDSVGCDSIAVYH